MFLKESPIPESRRILWRKLLKLGEICEAIYESVLDRISAEIFERISGGIPVGSPGEILEGIMEVIIVGNLGFPKGTPK